MQRSADIAGGHLLHPGVLLDHPPDVPGRTADLHDQDRHLFGQPGLLRSNQARFYQLLQNFLRRGLHKFGGDFAPGDFGDNLIFNLKPVLAVQSKPGDAII